MAETISPKLKVMATMTWLAPGGGVDHAVANTFTSLAGRYHFMLGVGSTIEHNEFLSLNIPIYQCPSMHRQISPLADLRSVWYFYKLFKRLKIDILHTHEAKASVVTRIAAWMAGVPVIIFGLEGVTFNDPMHPLKRKFYIFIERCTIWMNHFIIPVGQDTIDQYHLNGLGRQIPYEIVYSGIDTEVFIKPDRDSLRQVMRQKLAILPGQIALINIGRFSPGKNQRALIEMMPALRTAHPDLLLLLVGEGEEMENCRNLAQSLGIADGIRFIGHSQEIPALLYAADIFVFTSHREGLPRVLVEAGMCRLPVVTYEVEGAAEIIENGASGYIIAKGDEQDFIAKTLALAADPDQRKQFGQNLFNFVRHKWDVKQMATQLDLIYQKLFNHQKPS